MTLEQAGLHASECEGEVLPCMVCGNAADCRPQSSAPRRGRRSWMVAIAATVLLAFGLGGARAAELPGDSVYHLDAPLVDHRGKAMKFSDGSGKPRIASMFYASCKFVCPMIVDTLKKTERALPESERDGFDVLLVSIDPDRDTPTALAETARKHRIDDPSWHLAQASKADVRRIAAVLGIQYKPLDDGEFSHSSTLILLDAQGRIVARSDKLGEADPEFVAALRRTLAAKP